MTCRESGVDQSGPSARSFQPPASQEGVRTVGLRQMFLEEWQFAGALTDQGKSQDLLGRTMLTSLPRTESSPRGPREGCAEAARGMVCVVWPVESMRRTKRSKLRETRMAMPPSAPFE